MTKSAWRTNGKTRRPKGGNHAREHRGSRKDRPSLHERELPKVRKHILRYIYAQKGVTVTGSSNALVGLLVDAGVARTSVKSPVAQAKLIRAALDHLTDKKSPDVVAVSEGSHCRYSVSPSVAVLFDKDEAHREQQRTDAKRRKYDDEQLKWERERARARRPTEVQAA